MQDITNLETKSLHLVLPLLIFLCFSFTTAAQVKWVKEGSTHYVKARHRKIVEVHIGRCIYHITDSKDLDSSFWFKAKYYVDSLNFPICRYQVSYLATPLLRDTSFTIRKNEVDSLLMQPIRRGSKNFYRNGLPKIGTGLIIVSAGAFTWAILEASWAAGGIAAGTFGTSLWIIHLLKRSQEYYFIYPNGKHYKLASQPD